MLRFIVLFVLGTVSSISFAASSEHFVEDSRRITAESVRNRARDYSTVIKGYAAFLRTVNLGPALQPAVSEGTLTPAMVEKIPSFLASFSDSMHIDGNRWDAIAVIADTWIANLKSGVAADAPADLLNALLEFRLAQEEDYAILQHQKITSTEAEAIWGAIAFNEVLQKGQLDDLQDIWGKVFNYVNPLYQEHYSHVNPRYTGSGQNQYTIHNAGDRNVRELKDPTVHPGIITTLIQRTKSQAGKPMAVHMMSTIGVALSIPNSILREDALPTATLEPYESGVIEFRGHTVTLDAQKIIFRFPGSELRVELSRLPSGFASDMVEQFNQTISKMVSSTAISITRERKPATATAAPTAVDPETEYMHSLSADQLAEYILTGKRPDAASTSKPTKGKKGNSRTAASTPKADAPETVPTIASAATLDPLVDSPEKGDGRLKGGGASSAPAAPATPAAPAGGGGFRIDSVLKNVIMKLAGRWWPEPALPERAYAMRRTELDGDHKNMLSNLTGINRGRHGPIKAVNTYNWSDFVSLMTRLGFTESENHTFTYDNTRRITLHYIHSTSHLLYDDLMSIWRSQMANIGFDQAYLESLLK